MVIALGRNLGTCDEVVPAGADQERTGGALKLRERRVRRGRPGDAIGSRVAAIANAFGCEVYGYNRSPKTLPGVKQVDLDTLLSECDIVSLHVPSNGETKGLFSRQRLAMMKPSAILINVARGAIVDNVALAEALNQGQLAGAGIDVFDQEPPLPRRPPCSTPRTRCSPPMWPSPPRRVCSAGRRSSSTISMLFWREGQRMCACKRGYTG